MNYAKVEGTQLVQYPYGLGELSAERPGSVTATRYDLVDCFNHTDLPTAGFSLVRVDEEPIPVFDPLTQTCTLASVPVLENGSWVLRWAVENKSDEQLAVELHARKLNVRARRNELLAQSDWTQLADSPADKAAWAQYRQALRDLTDQTGFPDNITWPDTPSAFGVVRV